MSSSSSNASSYSNNSSDLEISGPMDISSPYNTKHVTHVGFDQNTGEFTGLPREWHVLLKASGISQLEQEKNPQVYRIEPQNGRKDNSNLLIIIRLSLMQLNSIKNQEMSLFGIKFQKQQV